MKKLLSRSISLSLALRYLNPLRTLFSIITLICLIGVALGVMVLIVVLSVMGGLQKEIQGNLFAHSPHVQVNYINELGGREVIGDWEELSAKLKDVPGVESTYGLVEDYALVDVGGRQRPCFFRAIDTNNTEQLEDLKRLVTEGSSELDEGEKVVVSSLVAEALGLQVGGFIRVYTTRNFQEISHAYHQTELPLAADKYAAQLKELEAWGKGLKTKDGRQSASAESVAKVTNALNSVLSDRQLRDSERGALSELQYTLSGAEDKGRGELMFPDGTNNVWAACLEPVIRAKKNEADMEYFRQIKSLVLPKDLEIIGIYRASQHTPSPDLFIPLNVGQELLNYDYVVQAIALRVNDPYRVETMLEPVKQGLQQLSPESQWALQTWQDRFSSWFALMQRERQMMSFVLSFISMISAFCIMAVMFTVSIQRKKEIAVMKALGATPFQVVRVFLWQGVIIGFLGAVLGVILALVVLDNRTELQAALAGMGMDPFPVAFHGTQEIPAVIDWADMIWQGVKAFIMVVIASIIPALITARQDPAKSLRSM